MTVYTSRLGVLSGSAPGVWLELFRAHPDFVTVVRDVVVTNATTQVPAESAIRIRPLTRAGEWWLWYRKDFPIGTEHVELRQVVEPGEALEFYTTLTGMYVAVTGYLLSR